MSDLKLKYYPESGFYDLDLEEGDIKREDGIKTSVLISILTDRIILEESEQPNGPEDRRGFWGDDLQKVKNDFIGSKAWASFRNKKTPSNVNTLKERLEDCLKWLVLDGVASEVIVNIIGAEDENADFGFSIDIIKPTGPENFKFDLNWEAERIEVYEL
jgi:phage gp46-like protein